jgi:DNA-binding PadR family transcriptional regulator
VREQGSAKVRRLIAAEAATSRLSEVEVSEDLLRIEEGSLYPALHRLEAQGFIASEWGASENNRRARFYRLMPRGRSRIAVEVSRWRRLVDVVNRVIDPVES